MKKPYQIVGDAPTGVSLPERIDTVGEKLGEGFQYIVRALEDNWVVKTPNPIDLRDSGKKDPDQLEVERSKEHIQRIQEDYEFFNRILPNSMLSTLFIYGKTPDGPTSGMQLQVRYEETLNDRFIREFSDQIEIATITGSEDLSKLQEQEENAKFFDKYRPDIIKFLWATKVALIKKGVVVDLHAENIAVLEEGLKLVEVGALTVEKRLMNGKNKARALRVTNSMFDRLENLRYWEKAFNISDEDLESLNQELAHGESHFDIREYKKAVSELKKQKAMLESQVDSG
jgi:hypothetical protein